MMVHLEVIIIIIDDGDDDDDVMSGDDNDVDENDDDDDDDDDDLKNCIDRANNCFDSFKIFLTEKNAYLDRCKVPVFICLFLYKFRI